tara:strand:- start:7393 stop:8271 length:879 start_codon:yes stop_codon:yes gene_type:complete
MNTKRNIIRWAGSKRLLLDHLSKSFPDKIHGKYIEPFVGSSSVLSWFDRDYLFKDLQIIINDKNSELINFYKVIKDKFKEFDKEIKKEQTYFLSLRKNKKNDYYKDKVNHNSKELMYQSLTKPIVSRAIRFYILNRLSFNGIYRVNAKGKYNVPMDKTKENIFYDQEVAENLHKILYNNSVRIYNYDYKKIFSLANKDDFLYIDPPYYSEKNNSYIGYTKKMFDKTDHENLYSLCLKISSNKIKFLLSSSDNKFTKNFFKQQFKIKKVHVRRTINSNVKQRNIVKELLIKNY